ncbi:hypothetical protein [Roseateles sp.]|uniref:hypothetical protein n=1 Tax=Roseateles sp. TaxID=1971397 RepID=UPI0032642DCC
MQWHRPRSRRVQVAAVLASVIAAGTVLYLFDSFGIVGPSTHTDRQLVATVDLRIGNPVVELARGEAKARKDLDDGLLQLQTFLEQPPSKADLARAERLKTRYGVIWISRGAVPTPQSQAYADGYNRVVQAEIERLHGQDFLERLLRDSGLPKLDKAAPP